MKLLLLTTVMEPGGAQKAMLTLARSLRGRGHEVVVAVMYDKGGYVPRYSAAYSLDIIDLQMKPSAPSSLFSRLAAAIRGGWRLIRLSRGERFDVIQTYTHYSNIVGPIIGRLSGVPVRVTSQRNNLSKRSKWIRVLDRIVANSGLTHAMVCVSEHTRRYCIEERIRAEKLVTIRNGIDAKILDRNRAADTQRQLRSALRIDDRCQVVIVVARLHLQKGHAYLLDAVPEVLGEFPNAMFILVGEGELEGQLNDRIENLDIRHAVRLLGARSDVDALLAMSDVFVLPSLWEGMPNAVMEAMAAGLPVVATAVDGTPEVVEHESTGLLVGPGDPDALASALMRLLRDESLRVAFGRAGRERIRTSFLQETVSKQYEALYLSLLRRHG